MRHAVVRLFWCAARAITASRALSDLTLASTSSAERRELLVVEELDRRLGPPRDRSGGSSGGLGLGLVVVVVLVGLLAVVGVALEGVEDALGEADVVLALERGRVEEAAEALERVRRVLLQDALDEPVLRLPVGLVDGGRQLVERLLVAALEERERGARS